MKYNKYIINNMNVYNIKTSKFKNAYIEFRFRDYMQNIDAPVRTFMLQLMNTTNKKYRTDRELNIALEEIYDADIYTGGYRTGNIYIGSIGIEFLSPKYIKEKDYFNNVFNSLVECIVNPNVDDCKWDELVYHNHIDNFAVHIDKYLDSPVDYTIIESRKRLFKGSIVANRIVGTKEDLKRINPESLYSEWNNMLNNSAIDVIVVGELDMDDVASLIKNCSIRNNSSNEITDEIIIQEIKPFKSESESKDFNQTNMIMYFQNKGLTDKEKYFIGPVFRNILGGGGLSDKLGNYLRMQNSLCYAYSCQIINPDSYMFIGTSLSKDNVAKAKEFIIKAFDDMKNGNITTGELMMHQEKFLTDIKARQDDIFAIGNNYYYHDLLGTPLFDEYNDVIKRITIKEIVEYANKWIMTYLFVLKER